MLKNEREREIVSVMKERGGFITVGELCGLLYASESSVRRDLTALERHGVLKRVYGGAELITNYSSVVSFNYRSHENVAEKKTVAKKAASLIKDGDVVFIDQSSTSLYLAYEILENTTLTVVTNNIEIASLLSGTTVRTIVSGGVLCPDNRTCMVGADAISTFNSIHADIAFFSAKSLTEDGVIYDCSMDEVDVRRAMLNNSGKKVFMCTGEKLGTQSAYRQCHLNELDYFISDSKNAEAYARLAPNIKLL